jgi:hypothetical protein
LGVTGDEVDQISGSNKHGGRTAIPDAGLYITLFFSRFCVFITILKVQMEVSNVYFLQVVWMMAWSVFSKGVDL